MTAAITLYHNPSCSKSQGALALLQAHGQAVHIIDYQATPLSAPELLALQQRLGLSSIRGLLRSKADAYSQLQLEQTHWSQEQLLAFMVQYPALLERPIVLTPKGAGIARPPERLLEWL